VPLLGQLSDPHPDETIIIDRMYVGSGCCLHRDMDNTKARHSYDSLSTCINDLQKRGYTADLEVNERGLISRVREEPLDPELFTIDEFYRFEGTSDPADMSIVYAISSEELGIKGLIVNAFGTYASGIVNRMVSRLDVHAGNESYDRLTP
jgi:hypothetical protein